MDFGLLMGKTIASLEKEGASLDPTDAAHSGIVAHSVLRYGGLYRPGRGIILVQDSRFRCRNRFFAQRSFPGTSFTRNLVAAIWVDDAAPGIEQERRGRTIPLQRATGGIADAIERSPPRTPHRFEDRVRDLADDLG
jgi:hypothetical protein